MKPRRLGSIVAPVVLALVLTIPLGRELGAAGQQGANYLGPKLCAACHKASHPEVVTSWSASAHARAMWRVQDADEERRIAADFENNPPFPKDKVAYVLGTGSKSQAFLDKELRVLPAEWLVKEKTWRSREAADATTGCLGCHTTGFDPETRQWKALGVGCEMCHGPGSSHVGAKDKQGTIVAVGKLGPASRAMVCGQCHAQGRSKDGRFAFPRGYQPGDDLNQFFVLADEVPKGAMNSQYNELAKAGKHLAAGTVCDTCHQPHGPVKNLPAQLRQPVTQLCLSADCHGGKLTGAQHEPEALAKVSCPTCHMPGSRHTFSTQER